MRPTAFHPFLADFRSLESETKAKLITSNEVTRSLARLRHAYSAVLARKSIGASEH